GVPGRPARTPGRAHDRGRAARPAHLPRTRGAHQGGGGRAGEEGEARGNPPSAGAYGSTDHGTGRVNALRAPVYLSYELQEEEGDADSYDDRAPSRHTGFGGRGAHDRLLLQRAGHAPGCACERWLRDAPPLLWRRAWHARYAAGVPGVAGRGLR